MLKILLLSKWKEFISSFEELQTKYDTAATELHKAVKEREAYKRGNEEFRTEYDKLLEKIQKLELERDDRIVNANIIKEENAELKKQTQNYQALLNDLAEFRKRNYDALESSNPIILKDFYDLITEVQREVVFGSLRAREIHGIAYRDGGNDVLKILKDKVASYMKKGAILQQKKKVTDELKANVEG